MFNDNLSKNVWWFIGDEFSILNNFFKCYLIWNGFWNGDRKLIIYQGKSDKMLYGCLAPINFVSGKY